MSTLSQFAGGSRIGEIIQGIFPDNSKYLLCDGVSTTPVTAANASLAKVYPYVVTGTSSTFTSNYNGMHAYAVAYGNGVWVAVGAGTQGSTEQDTNYCLTSTDGVNWAVRFMPHSLVWRGVAWNGARFVAIGTNAAGDTTQAAWSADGITWTTGNWGATSTPGRVISVVGGRFWVTPLTSSTSYYSDDGSSWTAGGTTGVASQCGIGFRGYAIIGGGSGNFYYKAAGASLTSNWIAGQATTGNITGFASNGTVCVATSTSANQTMTSPDGITWTARTAPAMYGVAWTGSTFAGFSATGVYTSVDGVSWAAQTTNFYTDSSQRWLSATDGTTTMYVDFAANGTQYLVVTTNGYTATFTALPKNNYYGTGVNPCAAYSSSLGLYVMGGGTNSSFDATPILFTSPDGIVWTERALEVGGWQTVANTAITSIVWSGTQFLAQVGNTPSLVLESTNGTHWRKRLTGATGATGYIAYGAGKWALCNSSGSLWTSTDAVTWAAQLSIGFAPVGLAWNGTTFAVLSSGGSVSTNATASGSWTAQTVQSGTFVAMIAHGTTFVASLSGSNSTVISSTTATGTWTTRNMAAAVNSAKLHSDGTTLAVSPNGTFQTYQTSANLTAWSSPTVTRSVTNGLNSYVAVMNGSQFVVDTNSASGTLGTAVWVTPNGSTWAERSLQSVVAAVSSMTVPSSCGFGGKVYVAPGVGNAYSSIHTFEDGGATLRPRRLPAGPGAGATTTFYCVAASGSTLVALGVDSANTQPVIATSTDGTAWTVRTNPSGLPATAAAGRPTQWTNLVWTGSQFLATSNTHAAMYSADGATWTATTVPSQGVLYGGLAYVAGLYLLSPVVTNVQGSLGVWTYYTSPDAVTWTARTSPTRTVQSYLTTYFASSGSVAIMVPSTVATTNTGAHVYRSTDGLTWTRYQAAVGNSVLQAGQPPAWTGSFFTCANLGSYDGKVWFATGLGNSLSGSANGTTVYTVNGTTLTTSIVDATTIKSPNLNTNSSSATPMFQLSLTVG